MIIIVFLIESRCTGVAGPCRGFLKCCFVLRPAAAPRQAPLCPGRAASGSIFKDGRSRMTAGERAFSGPGTRCLTRAGSGTGARRCDRGGEVKDCAGQGSDGRAAPSGSVFSC